MFLKRVKSQSLSQQTWGRFKGAFFIRSTAGLQCNALKLNIKILEWFVKIWKQSSEPRIIEHRIIWRLGDGNMTFTSKQTSGRSLTITLIRSSKGSKFRQSEGVYGPQATSTVSGSERGQWVFIKKTLNRLSWIININKLSSIPSSVPNFTSGV